MNEPAFQIETECFLYKGDEPKSKLHFFDYEYYNTPFLHCVAEKIVAG